MAYSPPNTFSATAVIVAADVQENLDEIKKYVNGSAVGGDLKSSSLWVEPKHIVQGYYNPLSNMHDFVSGVSGGMMSDPDDESWICDGPTARASPSSPDRVCYPNAGIEFYLESPADVLFKIHATPIMPDDAKVSSLWSRVYMFLDETQISSTKMYTSNAKNSSPTETDPGGLWRQWHNFYISKNLAAGWHSLTLRGYTTYRYSYLVDWGCTMEAYYL
jgi:hypothetical protein